MILTLTLSLSLKTMTFNWGAGAALESDLSGGGGDNMDLDSDVENGDEEYFTADSGDEEGLLESESDDSNDSSDSSDSGSDFDPEAGPVAIQHLPIPNQLNEPLYNDAPLTILQHVLVVQHHFLRFRVSRVEKESILKLVKGRKHDSSGGLVWAREG